MEIGSNKPNPIKPILIFNDVSKSYHLGRSKPFHLRNISFQIHAGEILRIRGNSGAGKSTIMRLAALLTLPDSGEIQICGKHAKSWNECDKMRFEHVGILFQDGNLFNHLTLIENLSIADKQTCRNTRYKDLLEQFDIHDLAKVKASRLSGGELQRAAICRALVNNPDLLLLDEPTSSLDNKATQDVIQVITYLQSEHIAVVLASHDARLDGLETSQISLE